MGAKKPATKPAAKLVGGLKKPATKPAAKGRVKKAALQKVIKKVGRPATRLRPVASVHKFPPRALACHTVCAFATDHETGGQEAIGQEVKKAGGQATTRRRQDGGGGAAAGGGGQAALHHRGGCGWRARG